MPNWSRRQVLATAVVGALAGCSLNPFGTSSGSAWPLPFHDAGNTNYNSATSVFAGEGNPTRQWSTSLLEDEQPFALGRVLLFAEGRLYCLTTTTPASLQVLTAAGRRTTSFDRLVPQAVVDGVLYGFRYPPQGPSGSPQVVAVDVASGETRWTTTVAAARVQVAGTRVYAVSERAVVVLDAATGDRLWSFPVTGSDSQSFVAVSSRTVVVSTGRAVVALDPTSGQRRWRFTPAPADTPPARLARPVVQGGTVYVQAVGEATTSPRPRLWALDLATGDRQWTWESQFGFGWIVATRTVVTNGNVALDAATGERRWQSEVFDVASETSTAVKRVVGTRNAVVVATGEPTGEASGAGGLYAIDRRTGRRLWSQSVGSPVWGLIAVGDHLYARTTDGRVRAFR